MSAPGPDDPRAALRADCSSCSGLCCVALPFTRSADFAITKDAGTPCTHLREDFGCGIHANLRDRGFPGCTVFDCFGAGQQVSQVTFGGRDWRGEPGTAQQMFEVFGVMRQLHELLWYLTEALTLPSSAGLHGDLAVERDRVERLTRSDAEELARLDVAAVRDDAGVLLRRTSEVVRAQIPGRRPDHQGADLMGARLRGADLRGANLRGAYLIAADLRDADLESADVIGADLRNADVRGARLAGSLFLTQPQVNAARGDAATTLPSGLERPPHWGVAGGLARA